MRAAFEANFADNLELGARFTLVEAGQVVVDIWGGFADRRRTLAFDHQTLTPIFSTTKALAALLVARAVDRGRLDYHQPMASIWPAFGAGDKDQISVEMALSHQAGLSGFPDETDPAVWFDWQATCAKLAAMTPIWPPGSASGYHPVTYGYLAGEIFRLTDGRTMGKALRQDIAEPLELDLWIGLPDDQLHRLAEMQRPNALPRFGTINAATEAAFLKPWSQPGGRGQSDWRKAEIPSANGHATALALARLAGALANDGWLDGESLLSPALIAEASQERIRGQDLVLPFEMSWGAGFMRNETVGVWGPGANTFGHSGWGGSCLFVDPDRRLGGAYVMNRQSAELIGDGRSRRLIEAAYASL